jgi:hypothetical protein
MSQETYPVILQAMIDRAGSLTAAETKALGQLWESSEKLALNTPSVLDEAFGELALPLVTNEMLIAAWENALNAAGNAGRANEIDAARAAGRAATRDDRHVNDSESSKNGAEEAVRCAVLAVGVRDLIDDEDYQALVTPWQKVLGTELIERV